MAEIFERKVEKEILDYFKKENAPILVIEGARQIGKTFVIEKLGSTHFKNYVYLNMVEDKQGQKLFEGINTTSDFYMIVQAYSRKKLGDSTDTLIFIDEIQEYPQLLTLLKFFKEEDRYRFIASGSLLGITLRKTVSIPIGSMESVRMHPMDFEEYLWASGFDKNTVDVIKEKIVRR